MARSPRFSRPPASGRPKARGGHGRDAAGAGGGAAAQRAARPLPAAAGQPGRAAAPGPGGGRSADASAAHRLLPAAVPARPGLRPRPGLAGKHAPPLRSPAPAGLGTSGVARPLCNPEWPAEPWWVRAPHAPGRGRGGCRCSEKSRAGPSSFSESWKWET